MPSGAAAEAGEDTILDFAVLAEGFAHQGGRRGVTVGEGGDIDGYIRASGIKQALCMEPLDHIAMRKIHPTESRRE